MARASRRSRDRSGSRFRAAIALALAACAQPAPERSDAPRAGEWRAFEGTWSAAGDRRALELGSGGEAAIHDLSGSILLTGERGLGVGFQARAITFSDGTASSVGRAVWTDERGDRIFSELRGGPVASGRRIAGTITGGTGRWTGIIGEYAFDWTYVVEADGRVQGRTADLRGRARIETPGGGPR
jgi:hypothetical protein